MIIVHKTVVSIMVLVLLIVPFRSAAQATMGDTQGLDSLRVELRSLRNAVDSLRLVLEENQEYTEDDLNALEKLLDEKMRTLEAKVDAANRSTSYVVFNPRTTAFINFAGRADNHRVAAASGLSDIDNRLFMRTVELDFRAPVDPYAEAVTILALEDEAGTGYAIDVEEAYGIIKRLPLLETAPLGLKWKIGRFRMPFGQSNMLHMHDLPWTTRPLPVVLYLGTEHGPFFESGTNPVGMDFTFFLPSPISGITMEASADILRGGSLGLSQGHPGGKLAGMGHLTISADWSNNHLLVIGASVYEERGPGRSSLYGADFLYRWTPAERRSHQSFVVGGEVFLGDHRFDDPALGTVTVTPSGWFSYLQYQASYRWYLGVRYDRAEDPSDPRLVTQGLAGYASYYTTEFLRFRFGVEYSRSDIPALNNLISGMFEVNFVYGSHPTEPYWVSR